MEKFDVDDYEEEDMQDPISEIPEKADEEEALIESEEEEDEED